jgi:hypothetical protein
MGRGGPARSGRSKPWQHAPGVVPQTMRCARIGDGRIAGVVREAEGRASVPPRDAGIAGYQRCRNSVVAAEDWRQRGG